MRQSNSMRFWNIVYPVGIYYVVTAVALFVLDFFLPAGRDNQLLRQLVTSVAATPFLLSFYRRDCRMRQDGGKPFSFKSLLFAFALGACFAVAWNNVLGMLRLAERSASYSQTEQTFYTGQLALELGALCAVIPFVEELLYRGIVYGRIRDWLGIPAAAVGSSLIFGLVHGNLVQFVYASVFGLLLGYLAERAGGLPAAVAAHMAANLTSVLRAETGIFGFLERSPAVLGAATAVLFAVVAIGIWLTERKQRDAD